MSGFFSSIKKAYTDVKTYTDEECRARARQAVNLAKEKEEIRSDLAKTEAFLAQINESGLGSTDSEYITKLVQERLSKLKVSYDRVANQLASLV